MYFDCFLWPSGILYVFEMFDFATFLFLFS